MATKGIRELFGDAIVDPQLRVKLVEHTEEAVREGEYVLEDGEMAALKEIIASGNLDNLSVEELDARVALNLCP